MKNTSVSFRITEEAKTLIAQLADGLGISQASVFELAIRNLNKTEHEAKHQRWIAFTKDMHGVPFAYAYDKDLENVRSSVKAQQENDPFIIPYAIVRVEFEEGEGLSLITKSPPRKMDKENKKK